MVLHVALYETVTVKNDMRIKKKLYCRCGERCYRCGEGYCYRDERYCCGGERYCRDQRYCRGGRQHKPVCV